MKQITIKLILLFTLFAAQGESIDPFAPKRSTALSEAKKTHTFRVSQVGADKTELLAVYAAVHKIAKSSESNEPGVKSKKERFDTTDFKIANRVSSTEFIVRRRWAVIDSVSGRPYLLITKKPKQSVQGDSLSGIIAEETGEIAERDDYRRTLGYDALRILREVDEIKEDKFSKEEFVARLRAGETWLLKSFKTEKCLSCMGKGQLGKLSHYAKCTNCKGKGGFPVNYLVKW